MKIRILAGAALILSSCAQDITNSDVVSQQPVKVAVPRAFLETLQAGYLPIDKNNKCGGAQTGIIRIHVSEILNKLNTKKTIGDRNDINKIDATSVSGEPDISEGLRVKRAYGGPGFPTIFDIETVAVTNTGQNEVLVGSGKFVIVRVILDMEGGKNDNVRFLYPGVEYENSEFAIMRTVGTDIGMFCGLAKIDYSTTSNGKARASIDFGIESIGSAAYGGFGIGLLITDKNDDQTPIIIDPNVKNNG